MAPVPASDGLGEISIGPILYVLQSVIISCRIGGSVDLPCHDRQRLQISIESLGWSRRRIPRHRVPDSPTRYEEQSATVWYQT